MRCPNKGCNTDVDPKAKFCPRCGSPVRQPSSPFWPVLNIIGLLIGLLLLALRFPMYVKLMGLVVVSLNGLGLFFNLRGAKYE
jgi:hypothetical protein